MQDGCKKIYSFPRKPAPCIQWYLCITALLLASLHLFKTWILFWSLSVTVLMFSGFKVRLVAWWLVSGEWENYRSTKRQSSFRTADIAVSYIGHSSNVFIQPAILTQGICIEVTENRKSEILYPNATSTSHSSEIQRYFEASLALMEWLYWEIPGRHPNQCLIYPQLALFNANGQNCFTEPFKHVWAPAFFLNC